ncbi:MAG TPA: 2-oxoacid:acceptor oxidoreductase subunit alpha [Planctomycetota bacterium]|nr:2-oxoacid:acceptor oxidoreductase subunit alpha [Planctomycetota bacterium]
MNPSVTAQKEPVLEGKHFINGAIACAEGAIVAGCRFFAGYPITPATEVAERMSERLPHLGGIYIQMEDEIASMAAILGASWGGKKSMTATSGPGFSLMMENLGLGIMTETPCVVVNMQRAGPSTGLPTYVGQGDMMQARWGSHGVYEIIALAPSSPQEALDLTITAFNLSEEFRLPVLIMGDEIIAHMTERVIIPTQDKVKIYPRRKPTAPPDEYLPYQPANDLVPSMATAGDGYHIQTTGLTHNEKGYPVMTVEAHQKLVKRLIDKIILNKDKIIRVEEENTNDADVVVCSYGSSARIAEWAIKEARAKGIKVGKLRLITVWPFPNEQVSAVAKKIKAFVVPEINNGQISLEVERCAAGKARVISVPHLGGATHNPQDILDAIIKAASPPHQSNY